MTFDQHMPPRADPHHRRSLLCQLARFNLVGIMNTGVDFGLFFLLTAAGTPYIAAQICSYGCGIVNSYLFNKRWTFTVPGASVAEAARFAAVSLTALCLSVVLVYLFHEVLKLGLVPSKVVATLLTMLASFIGSRMWVFGAAAREVR